MKALVLKEYNTLVVEDVPTPIPQEGDRVTFDSAIFRLDD